jgi:hypothetical protein
MVAAENQNENEDVMNAINLFAKRLHLGTKANRFQAPCLSSLLLLALPAIVQGQFGYTTTNGAITITLYFGPGGAVSIPSMIDGLPVTGLGANVFLDGPSNVTEVTISSTITNLGYRALDGSDVTAITVDPLNPAYSSLDGVLYDKTQTMLLGYPAAKQGDYSLPDTVTNIPMPLNGAGGLWARQNLTGIEVGALNPVFSSLDGVLYDKQQLTLIVYPGAKTGPFAIPSTVTNIEASAFSRCFGLTSVVVPDTVTSMGESVFYECMGLTNLTIPGSLSVIPNYALENCTNLGNVIILDGVTDIGFAAFRWCSALTKVLISSTVTNIDNSVFSGCTSLTNVTIGSGVSTIDFYAFLGCSNLLNVYFTGNAPATITGGFSGDNVTLYYLPGTLGWSNTLGPDFFGYQIPSVLWNPSITVASTQHGQFIFDISGTKDIPIVVEASTSLPGGTWVPLMTGTLTNGLLRFIDSSRTNYMSRFYRIGSP